MTEIRHRVEPRDIPPVKAARRLHLTMEKFWEVLPELIKRGFPRPDPTTGNFFLPAIDKWMESRGDKITGKPDAEAIMLERLFGP